MDYLLFSVVLIAATTLGCLILLYSAFKLLLSCPKRNSTRRDLEQGPVPRQEQYKPCHIVEEKNSYFIVKTQDGNTSDSFIEATNETSSLQTSSDSSSNVSTGTQNDSGIHEYEEGTHKNTYDSRDFIKEELTLNSSFLSLDMSEMFREADTEIEEDNSDSKMGFSSHLRVEIDINDDLDADFVHMESEDQDRSVTTKHQLECVHSSYSDSPTLSLFGLINKLSYFYCL